MSMEVLHDTTGKKEAAVYYMDAPLPYAIEENFGGCFFEDDVDLAQVLQDQLAVDEALARDLQAMEDQIAKAAIEENNRKEGRKPAGFSTSNNGNTSVSRSSQVLTEDGVDPDNMTYEELQQLGETIGTHSKGLPEDVIALLKSSTYKIGIFSRKEKHDECVICCMAYKNRDKLTTLPCQHQYHRTCVAKWLKINKVCPVCNKEVFGS
uniref:RING-type domain-containing protein n=1 Tax=Hordeum vulgare subsp. vulgare TaxID=112509 RepID=A0A8I6WRF7_HORVV